jgi:hypothetical protein
MEQNELSKILECLFGQLHTVIGRLNAFEQILCNKNLTNKQTLELEFVKAMKTLQKEIEKQVEQNKSKIVTLS